MADDKPLTTQPPKLKPPTPTALWVAMRQALIQQTRKPLPVTGNKP